MKTKYLIIDTTAFLQNAPLHEIGENMLTVQDVINEVKNKRQLRHLASLTYDLEVKDVFNESVTFVTEFSKKTGDFPCLSPTDIKVLALTYQLEKQYVGTDHLKQCPVIKRSVDFTNRSVVTPANTAGFYLPTKEVHKCTESRQENGEKIQETNESKRSNVESVNSEMRDSADKERDTSALVELVDQCNINDICNNCESYERDDYIYINNQDNVSATNDDTDHCSDSDYDDNSSDASSVEQDTDDDGDNDDDGAVVGSEESDCTSSEVDEDNSGWITPKNIINAKRILNPGYLEDTAVTVGCITTDFAMQNVLKQMGLNVIALDGRVIKEMRTFILRCYACFKTTSNMKKIFCPYCGNKTLKRVAVSIDENGNQQIHINLKKPLTSRGKRFPLPMPKGGKHAVNPRLVEDSRRPHQKPSRLARIKTDALHPDYTAGASPFAIRDVHSRSAQLGFAHGKPVYTYWMRKNPNEPRKTNRKNK